MRKQQDTTEFFNILIDNVENCHPALKQLVNQCFGGTSVNEIKSLEADYPYQSQREEPFYCLGLDIKNKKTLAEALDFYVKPEVLDGENKYQCDKYQTLVDAQRRNFLGELKETVVINLKRFEFDYNTMQHIKINDHLEFPHTVDFTPWTSAGLQASDKSSSQGGQYSEVDLSDLVNDESSMDDLLKPQKSADSEGFEDLLLGETKKQQTQEDSNLYELVGVLVHSGSANSGHYYSYIKERDGQQRWLEFNDRKVTDFDITLLAEKCYGNKEQPKTNPQGWPQQF